jgi:Uma2 family endonuclease
VAAPVKLREEPTLSSFPSPPYTVDTLFELPESNLRFEVLGGNLTVVPAPSPGHNSVLERLHRLFIRLLPADLELLTNTAVGLPGGDGPIPDLLVTTADPFTYPRWLPSVAIHTVVEVVSPSNAYTDRRTKTDLYAEAGIPCYWRVEQRPWKGHSGPIPAIVVRIQDKVGEWQQIIAPAGTETELPVVVDSDGTIVTVPIDPAVLTRRRGT